MCDDIAKIGSAPIIPPDAKKIDGVVVNFLHPPKEAKESYDYFHWVFTEWLTERLAKKEYIPSPRLNMANAINGLGICFKNANHLYVKYSLVQFARIGV